MYRLTRLITTAFLALVLTTSISPPAAAAPVAGQGQSVALGGLVQSLSGKVLSSRRPSKKIRTSRRAVRVAARQAGDPYRWGASGPHAFDCSGLTSFAFKRVGRHLPRTSSAQRAATKRISPARVRRGDLVFFHGSSGVYHVGIYAGSRSIWHAPSTGSRVSRARIWTKSVSYGRVR